MSHSREYYSRSEEATPSSCCGRLWKRLFPVGYKKEFNELFVLAWPAILTSFFQFLLLSQNVIFSGHLGKEELDAVALANSFINVLGFVIGLGLSTACDTLFSQTFGSANKSRVGMFMQRSFLVMYMFLLPLWTIWLNIEPILIAIGQDRAIARLCANYMTVAIPSLFFQYSFLILARFMQNQGVVIPPMLAAIIGNIVSAVLQYLLIYVLEFGYIGSAIALNIGVITMFSVELIYILVSKMYTATWTGLERESVFDVSSFLRLAIPGVMMVSMETWSFEIGTLLSGLLGTTDLGAQSVIFQIDSLAFMIPLGMSIAVNIRVGQQLGEMNAMGAMTTYRVGLTMIMATATTAAILIASLHDVLPWIFTSDQDVHDLASKVLPLIALFQIVDGLAAVSSGALRGAGHQTTGAAVSIVGFYVIALPVGITLAFTTELRIMGFWIGLIIGLTVESILFVTIVTRLNWKRECCKAQERAGITLEPASVKSKDGSKHGSENPVFNNEKTSLLTDSLSRRDRDDYHARSPYATTPLGSLRGTRISLPRPRVPVSTAVPTFISDSQFCKTVLLRVLTYFILLTVLGIGVMLHFCIPVDPGDAFCARTYQLPRANTSLVNVTQSTVTASFESTVSYVMSSILN